MILLENESLSDTLRAASSWCNSTLQFHKKKKKKKKKLYPKKQYLHHHRVNSKDWFDAIKSTLSEIYRINKYP